MAEAIAEANKLPAFHVVGSDDETARRTSLRRKGVVEERVGATLMNLMSVPIQVMLPPISSISSISSISLFPADTKANKIAEIE